MHKGRLFFYHFNYYNMNFIPILVFMGAAIVSTQAIDLMSGGASTAASLQKLAQNESATPQEEHPPLPQQQLQQPTQQFQPQPNFQQPPQPQPIPFNQGQPGPQNVFQEEHEPQIFVDPQEIRNVLREIRQIKSDLKRFINQLKKMAAGSEDLAKINELSAQLDSIQAVLLNSSSNDSELQDAIREFRDGEFWDEMNKIRAKVELPRELKQIASSIKRLEKLIALKTVQDIGLDIEKVRQAVGEMKQTLQTVQTHLANGELEEAMEAMQFFHEGGHPGEIEGTIHRVREIKSMLKRVKDQAVRSQADQILQEVIDAFNEGNWKDARETLDEYADDLMNLLQKLMRSQTQRGGSRNNQESFSKMQNLEGLIKNKLQEKGDMREQKQGGEPQFQFPNEMFKQFSKPGQGQPQEFPQQQQPPQITPFQPQQ